MSDVNTPKVQDCMLSFFLKPETYKYEGDSAQDWGYMGDKKWLGGDGPTFGALTEFQSNIDITKILGFYWEEALGSQTFSLKVSVYKSTELDILEFFKKKLCITVNHVSYDLGKYIDIPTYHTIGDNTILDLRYGNKEAEGVIAMLKRTGETEYFCLNWK